MISSRTSSNPSPPYKGHSVTKSMVYEPIKIPPFEKLLSILLGALLFLVSSSCTAPKVGSGYIAKRICSEVFVAGRDPKAEYLPEIEILSSFTSFEVDKLANSVTARTAGFGEHTASWHEGFGCALTYKTSSQSNQKQYLESKSGQNPLNASEQLKFSTQSSYPSKDSKIAKLDQVLDWAFKEHIPEKSKRTRAVIILHKGDLVAERYAKGFGPETLFLGWSAAKSVTHAIVGAAVQKGLVEISRPIGFKEWEDDTRSKITLDHLLRMVSGLEFNESFFPPSDLTDMLFLEPDMGKRAAEEQLEYEIGSHWSYSSGSSLLIMRYLREIQDDESYHRFPYETLFDPIGAHTAVFETDTSGTFVGSSYLYMSARDWARFGLLYAQDGVWQGNRIMPRGWAAYGCSPSSVAPRGQYGAHWWVNGGEKRKPEERMFPSLPGDTCMATGFEKQLVVLVPGHDLIIVRLGVTTDPRNFPVEEFIAKIIEAVSS